MDEACNVTACPCLSDHYCISVCACTLVVAILQGHPADHPLLSRCQHLLASRAEYLGGKGFTCKCCSLCVCISWMGCKSSILPLSIFACLCAAALQSLTKSCLLQSKALLTQKSPPGWSGTYSGSLTEYFVAPPTRHSLLCSALVWRADQVVWCQGKGA